VTFSHVGAPRVPRYMIESVTSALCGLIEAVERHLKVHATEHQPRDHGEPDCLSCRILEEQLRAAKDAQRGLLW
jgi:hypothetical protein